MFEIELRQNINSTTSIKDYTAEDYAIPGELNKLLNVHSADFQLELEHYSGIVESHMGRLPAVLRMFDLEFIRMLTLYIYKSNSLETMFTAIKKDYDPGLSIPRFRS
jgi:hypothetical protein